jgi:flagellar hook-associated protein 3 FlgL
MPDRITMSALNNTVLADNQRTVARLATYQQQLSSGKRINQVSDDPVTAGLSLRYRAESLQTDKYLENIEKGSSFIAASDTALGLMSGVMAEAKSLAVQGATGTQDSDSRRALASSVDSLLSRMVDLGNTVHDGRYIFSGTATFSQPFVKATDGSAVTYAGNLDNFDVQTGPTARTTVNQSGQALFKEPIDLFKTLIDVRDSLLANDGLAVSNKISDIDAAHDQLNNLHGGIGATQQRLDLARNQLESVQTNLGALISEAEDVDFAETIAQMQMAEVALEAGLQAGARVMRSTLLDYL